MNDDITQKDLHLIFTTSVEDIKFAKLQQWRITYYAMLLMAGIFYIRTYYQLHCFWHICLIIFILVLAFIALMLLYKIEKDILKYRTRIKEIQGNLSQNIQGIYDLDKNYVKIGSVLKISKYQRGFYYIQSFTILIAAFIFSFIPPILKC